MRIVSLLPSATEIICALGLEQQLVGVTHECDFPISVRQLPKVTQTLIPIDASSAQIDQLVRERLKNQRALYTLDLPTLETLRPDLIVTQALCDVCAVSEAEVTAAACSLPGSPKVLNLEPMTLRDVFSTLRLVGKATGTEQRAELVVQELESRVEAVATRSKSIRHRPRVVMLEWIDPPFSAGHWSPELVSLAGGDEQIGRPNQPSRSIQWADVLHASPEFLFIACCGFDIERTKVDVQLLKAFPGWSDLPAVKQNRVYMVDGSSYFNRPGPRLVESLELLAHALHPEVHPPSPWIAQAVRVS